VVYTRLWFSLLMSMVNGQSITDHPRLHVYMYTICYTVRNTEYFASNIQYFAKKFRLTLETF
jgi:hypothetical protein